jgi:NitT/TauT family transport system ATP-binding protein
MMLAPSGSAPPAVTIRDVTLHYFTPERETLALSSVSLEVERGEFIAVVGSSGCGKSTLLSIVSGLLAPSAGDIFIEGRKITAPSPQVGYMFQKDTLLEWRTVLDNVLIGAELLNLDMGVARRRAQELLRRYGLGESCTACRTSSPGACASARRWRAHCAPSPTCCCLTSRSRRSTTRRVWRSRTRSPASSRPSTRPSSS